MKKYTEMIPNDGLFETEKMATDAKPSHHTLVHPKDIRRKHIMAKKYKQLTEANNNSSPYEEESKKIVDSLPRIEREQQTEIKRLWYSPANCNCCWSENNHWYRRHHRTLRKKGSNKDNKPGHVRSALFRPPSYVSKYFIRQNIAEGLRDLGYN